MLYVVATVCRRLRPPVPLVCHHVLSDRRRSDLILIGGVQKNWATSPVLLPVIVDLHGSSGAPTVLGMVGGGDTSGGRLQGQDLLLVLQGLRVKVLVQSTVGEVRRRRQITQPSSTCSEIHLC